VFVRAKKYGYEKDEEKNWNAKSGSKKKIVKRSFKKEENYCEGKTIREKVVSKNKKRERFFVYL
jgi:hypothetical protein